MHARKRGTRNRARFGGVPFSLTARRSVALRLSALSGCPAGDNLRATPPRARARVRVSVFGPLLYSWRCPVSLHARARAEAEPPPPSGCSATVADASTPDPLLVDLLTSLSKGACRRSQDTAIGAVAGETFPVSSWLAFRPSTHGAHGPARGEACRCELYCDGPLLPGASCGHSETRVVRSAHFAAPRCATPKSCSGSVACNLCVFASLLLDTSPILISFAHYNLLRELTVC